MLGMDSRFGALCYKVLNKSYMGIGNFVICAQLKKVDLQVIFTTLTITRSPMFCPNTNDPLGGFAEDLKRIKFILIITSNNNNNTHDPGLHSHVNIFLRTKLHVF